MDYRVPVSVRCGPRGFYRNPNRVDEMHNSVVQPNSEPRVSQHLKSSSGRHSANLIQSLHWTRYATEESDTRRMSCSTPSKLDVLWRQQALASPCSISYKFFLKKVCLHCATTAVPLIPNGELLIRLIRVGQLTILARNVADYQVLGQLSYPALLSHRFPSPSYRPYRGKKTRARESTERSRCQGTIVRHPFW